MEHIEIIIIMMQQMHPLAGAFCGSLSGLFRDSHMGKIELESKKSLGFVFVGSSLGTFAGLAIYDHYKIGITENMFLCFLIGSVGLNIMIVMKSKLDSVVDALIKKFI